MTGDAKETGKLSVSVSTDSWYFNESARVDVRDRSLRLVGQTRNREPINLPPGLYEVSAILEDGATHRRLIEVSANEVSRVELRRGDGEAIDAPEAEGLSLMSGGYGFAPPASGADETSIPDVRVDGAEAELVNGKTWEVHVGTREPRRVVSATVPLPERTVEISLPTSLRNACELKLRTSPTGVDAVAWIPPARTIANALQNMVSSGELLHAARTMEEAVELLLEKYRDPTGAVLGGLILHRVGALHRYEGWIRNLARDFSWIPDGKIILASLLLSREDPGPSDLLQAVQNLRDVVGQRVLFTESYSLLMRLIRRWSRVVPDARGEATELVRRLVRFGASIEWSHTYFTTVLRGGDECSS